MPDGDANDLVKDTALERQAKWLIGLRLLLAFLFLGSAAVLAFREHPPFGLTPLFALIACTCFLSILYLLWLSRTRNIRRLCGLQIWIDLLLVTALIHYTGGIESVFAFVFIFPVLAAAMCVSRRSSFLVAGASSLLYSVLTNVQLYELIQRTELWSGAGIGIDPAYTIFQTFVNSVGFFLEALLGSNLAERLQEARREVEKQRIDIRNLRTLHREIVENIQSGIITLDLEGRIVSCNRSARQIIGLGAREMHDKSWRDTPFREIKALEEFFSTLPPSFSALSQEIEVRRDNGDPIPVEITFAPLTLPESVLAGLVGIFQDLTERKKTEARLRQADRLAVVGQLAASLAHEIRNPLAAISGSIELMKEEEVAQPQLLDIVLRETERLKLVTGQLLDFSRPTLDQQKPCNVVSLVEEAVPLLEKSCDSAHPVTFSVRREAEQVMVAGNPDQLKQVLWNLGLNAIQAMPTGGTLTLTVRRHIFRHDQRWAAIELTDTGRGIPPEETERIFDPFYTTKPGGTGLGLTIAQRIIDHLGGRIEVSSRAGGGSTFRVLLKQVSEET